ncbi:TPA: SOS response-associated peptidase family protein [Pseudomonas aeruginosa]|uniref:SOS response-associated peptidase n=1 Tax=Pseudomonas aeruginosa TaxID=287 RepID=UPI001D0A94A7|nr:SOS response-associated peptidase family protein [Pseudomonas aeruginosa]EKY4111650.1 SOS response-associated peptidase family protein [Pseudomonas aeruginosa]ELI8872603.1 SOS response-associated peptidase family protein [Pseudomonas aeruginosa]ELJ2278617.1 SOS response-associated peptidase family protein [Pseudomonas aeruginosa]MCC0559620.1 SOS response-associated peptidase [Pseudomonas aeruginosa]MCU8932960.1 SOS response-associated peptidase [Pseudomonas aeruginosa]
MCGRLSQYTGLHEFVDALSMPNVLVNLVGEQPQRYNVAPSTAVTTLRLEGDALVAQPIRWGWRPFWARDRAAPINARVEKVAHGRFFSTAWKHRALTPISGWFEWFEWVDGGEARKQPFHIQHRDGSPILCAAIGQFPGLDDEPADHHGFVIITADADGGLVDIHDRRPVVLPPELAREWIDPATTPERAEQIVLHQGEPSESFRWYAVDPAVGDARNQGAHLIEPQRSAS